MKIKTSPRAKHMRITIRPGGEVVATLPRGTGIEVLHRFLAQKSAWIARAIARMRRVKPKIALPRVDYRAVRRQAQTFVERRVRELNQAYGFSYRSIVVRNQKTRWGSCSRKGNLSFNYRVMLLPPELADYVIVHELCHLKEMNHSAQFWNLMKEALPDCVLLRKKLRGYQLYAS